MNQEPSLSIVVPTLNEADNIAPLVKRIDMPLAAAGVMYEIIIVDDHSSDDTIARAEMLADKYPIRTVLKQGKRGKAYSLLEGFEYAKHDLVAMIDADLQYPPEELATMYQLLTNKNADVVVTERAAQKTSPIRKLSTKIYNLLFARLLFGINYDTQSGLKMFRRSVMQKFDMTPSPWSFDLEFIVRALERKLKIINHKIAFDERSSGVTKVKLLNVTAELISASIKLRFRTSFRKVRAGYRANGMFLKRAFPLLIIGLSLGIATIHPPTSVSAISIPSIVQIVKDKAAPNKSSVNASSEAPSNQASQPAVVPPTTTPAAGGSSNSNTPIVQTPLAAATTDAVTPQVTTASAPIPQAMSTPTSPVNHGTVTPSYSTTQNSSNSSVLQNSQSGTNKVSASSSAHVTLASQSLEPLTVLSSADPSAITAGNTRGIYSAAYMQPSNKTVSSLNSASRAGLLIGGILLVYAAVAFTRNSYRKYQMHQRVVVN